MFEALLLDLDDTLYPESQFVYGGFRAAARHVAAEYGGACAEDILRGMTETLAVRGRRAVFTEVIARFGLPEGLLPALVDVYRSHAPEIALYPGYRELLERLGQRFRIGIITDGLPAVQRRKTDALGLNGLVRGIVYTWDSGAGLEKPHPEGFRSLMRILEARPSHTLHAGDNLLKDGMGARAAGIRFAHVRRRDGTRSGPCPLQPDFEVESLLQLTHILN